MIATATVCTLAETVLSSVSSTRRALGDVGFIFIMLLGLCFLSRAFQKLEAIRYYPLYMREFQSPF